jgi:PKD repeat protein
LANHAWASGGVITEDVPSDDDPTTVDPVAVRFDDPGEYRIQLWIADRTGASATSTIHVTVSEAEPSYSLTVVETDTGDVIGSTTVTDPTPLTGSHIGFSTVGTGAFDGEWGVVDSLRSGDGDPVEDWERSEPLDGYTVTQEGRSARFERFFRLTTSGQTSIRAFSGPRGELERITSNDERLDLTGTDQVRVDLLQSGGTSEPYDNSAHETRVELGTDADGDGGITLALVDAEPGGDGERTEGARLSTPNDRGTVAFELIGEQFYTFVLDVDRPESATGERVGDVTGNGQTATDPDGDTLYEDVNGDGTDDFDDVIDLVFADYDELNADSATRSALDFDGSGRVGVGDVVDLLFDL